MWSNSGGAETLRAINRAETVRACTPHGDDIIEGGERVPTMKSPSIFDWYRILRIHHHWTVFQAIRYALWLAR
jgi:hypothetical protein